MDKLGSLEQESLKRKERLKNLKRKVGNDNKDEANGEEALPKPIFRSYKPQDETIRENAIEQTITGDIENEVKDQLDLLKTPIIIEEIDIANLAPRKPDWDLKRDVAKKLEKLERRTQKAIAELIRERLKNNQDDIFQAVNVGTALKNSNVDDD